MARIDFTITKRYDFTRGTNNSIATVKYIRKIFQYSSVVNTNEN